MGGSLETPYAGTVAASRTGRRRSAAGPSGVRGVAGARAGYRLDLAALGVASRLPLQSLPTLTLLDAVSPAVVEAYEMSLASTYPSRPVFGVRRRIDPPSSMYVVASTSASVRSPSSSRNHSTTASATSS